MSTGISDQRMKGQGNQGMFSPSFGQQSSYNYFPNNGDNYNSWGSQQVNAPNNFGQQQQRRGPPYDDCYRGGDKRGYGNDGVKAIEHGVQGMGLDQDGGGGSNSRDYSTSAKSHTQSVASSATTATKETSTIPKKMTWASIASQPAKPQIRTNSSSSTLKKKGPGMPPPPMVPGRHNMDIGTWDSPKNGSAMIPTPVPVPSPPPVIDEPSPLSQQHQPKSNHNNNNNNATNNMTSNINSNNNVPQLNAPAGSNQHGGNGPSGSGFREERGSINHNRGSDRDRDRDGTHMQRQNWPNNQNNRGNGYQGGHYQPHHRSNYGPPNQMNYQQGDRNMPERNQQHQQSFGMNRSQQYRSSPPAHQQSPTYNVSSNPDRDYGDVNVLDQANATPASSSEPINVVNDEKTPTEIDDAVPVVDKLLDKNNYNPSELDLERVNTARFFIIKSYSEDDIHRSIKYEIWCSTEHGNKRLDQAFRESERDGGVIYLLFSVNGSGHFCGVAQMMTAVDYNSVSSVWHQDKWKGKFSLKWIYVKDVPNTQLRHIRLENNENKPVTNSRDTQEVPNAKGQQVIQIIHTYKHTTSIFDDFIHYEKRQVEEDTKRVEPGDPNYDLDEAPRPGSHPSHQYQSHHPSGGNGSAQSGRGYHRDGGQYHSGYDNRHGGYDNRGRNNYGHYQGGNRSGYHNYDNRRGGSDDYQPRGNNPNYDRSTRDYRDNNRRDDRGGFMSRDRDPPRERDNFNRDTNRGSFEHRDRMERSDDGGSGSGSNSGGGFKPRNNLNNFANRGSNTGGTDSGYRS